MATSYEWSMDLATWRLPGATAGGIGLTIGTTTIEDTFAPDNDLIEVTATITGNPQTLYVRLRTSQL